MSSACPEYGFQLTMHLAANADAVACRAALAEFAGALGLELASNDAHALAYVVTREGAQAIDSDREAVRAWAERRAEIAGVDIGPLIDLRETRVRATSRPTR